MPNNACSDLTITRLTPRGRAAVATCRIQGTGAKELVQTLLQTRTGSFSPDRPVFGRLLLGASAEEVIAHFISDSEVEIHSHGGDVVAEAIIKTFRRYEVQESSVIRTPPYASGAQAAEALLPQALTEKGAKILLAQLNGLYDHAIQTWENLQKQGRAKEATRIQNQLTASAFIGRHVTSPFSIALVGKPNVGKSSLLNALLGYDRALVSDLPGTTRDIVTASTAFDGWPVILRDTAGLRHSSEPIEQAGISLTHQTVQQSDLIMALFDVTDDADRPLDAFWSSLAATTCESDPNLFQLVQKKTLIILNKCDLPHELWNPCWSTPAAKAYPHVSARTGQGLDELELAIPTALFRHAEYPFRDYPFATPIWTMPILLPGVACRASSLQ
ncbi:MAG: 50S ribosome-binding GTPase [Planctomycetia bacterium]|nr:50S ribosome-binding GTPase [Planctomycetia bacterium]